MQIHFLNSKKKQAQELMLNAQDLPQGSGSNELERNNFENLRGNNNGGGRNFSQVSTIYGFSQQPSAILMNL